MVIGSSRLRRMLLEFGHGRNIYMGTEGTFAAFGVLLLDLGLGRLCFLIVIYPRPRKWEAFAGLIAEQVNNAALRIAEMQDSNTLPFFRTTKL